MSLGELAKKVAWAVHNAEINHQDINNVPVFLQNDSESKKYAFESCADHCGKVGSFFYIEFL